MVNLENVFEADRFEVQLVGGIVVGRNRFGVAVHHDGFVTHFAESHCSVAAAVVEFDTLTDSVRATAENHDLLRVVGSGRFVLAVVGAIVVELVFHTAHRHCAPAFDHAEFRTLLAHVLFADAEDLGDVLVAEAVLLGLDEEFIGREATRSLEHFFFELNEFAHLLHEVSLFVGGGEDFFVGSTLTESFVHLEVTFRRSGLHHFKEFFLALLVEVLGKAEARTAVFETTDSLLEGFLVGLADSHDFTHSLHLGAEAVVHAAELFECPASELEHHVVTARGVLFEASIAPVRNLVEGKAGSELCRNKSDRETSSLGSKSGGTRGTRVDFDDHHAARLGVMSELDVGTANHADGFHNLEGIALEAFFEGLVDGEERGCAEGVTGMHAHRVNVFDEADGNHLVLGVADHFDFEFFPTEDGFFDEALVRHGEFKTVGANGAEFFHVVAETAASTTHGVCRANDDRVTDFGHDLFGFFHRVANAGTRSIDAELLHGFLEDFTVFAAFDSIEVHTDDLHAVLVEHAGLVEGASEVQAGLTAQVREEGLRAFLLDNLGQAGDVQRFDVGGIGHDRVGHDGSRVGVHEHDLVTLFAQGLASLGAGIVEFASLTDNDRAGTNDKDFVDAFNLHFVYLR